jgi:hypothetical protein
MLPLINCKIIYAINLNPQLTNTQQNKRREIYGFIVQQSKGLLHSHESIPVIVWNFELHAIRQHLILWLHSLSGCTFEAAKWGLSFFLYWCLSYSLSTAVLLVLPLRSFRPPSQQRFLCICFQLTMACQETQTEITLKGSTEIVKEFFHYSINRSLHRCASNRRPSVLLSFINRFDRTIMSYVFMLFAAFCTSGASTHLNHSPVFRSMGSQCLSPLTLDWWNISKMSSARWQVWPAQPSFLSLPFHFEDFFCAFLILPTQTTPHPSLLYSRLVGKWQRAKTHSCCDWCGYERSARKMGF